MSDPTIKKALIEYCKENRSALDKAAKTLKKQNIARIYFGLDHINDDADLSDYANIEYENGKTETRNTWPSMLDEEIFGWLPYSSAYVFDAQTASILEDTQGGMHWPYENHAFAYHTPERLKEIEAKEEEFEEEMENLEDSEDFKKFMKELNESDDKD